MDQKTCNKCKKVFFINNFKIKNNSDLTKLCIFCLNKNKKWYSNNRRTYYEKNRNENRKYYQDCLNDIIEKQNNLKITFFK